MITKRESTPQIQATVNRLGEGVYEHFLREAGDCTDPEEWYLIATRVAEMFRDEIIQSRQRNGITAAVALPPH